MLRINHTVSLATFTSVVYIRGCMWYTPRLDLGFRYYHLYH